MSNIPNIITITRIFISFLIIPASLYWDMFFENGNINIASMNVKYNHIAIVILVIIAGTTDFFDGFVARKYNVNSDFGKVFDAIADKIFILSAFLALLYMNMINIWAVFLMLTRDFFVSAIRIIAAQKNMQVGANDMGKLKTTIQFIAIGVLFLNEQAGNILIWIAVAISLYSGLKYKNLYLKD